MLIAIVFLVLVALWRPRLTALLWLPALFCAVAAMHWTVSLHLSDPLMSLYSFLVGGLGARIVLELALRWCAARVTWAADCVRTPARRRAKP